MCLSKTYFNSKTSLYDPNLDMPGYKVFGKERGFVSFIVKPCRRAVALNFLKGGSEP